MNALTSETVTETTPVVPESTDVDPAATEVTTEPATETETQVQPAPKYNLPPSVINDLTGLRAAKRELADELAKARREAAEARELAERLARSASGDKTTQTEPVRHAPQSSDQYAADVQQAATLQRLLEDTVTVKNAGLKAFPDFQQTLGTLTALGVTSNMDVLADVMAVDPGQTHILLDKLAKDPERAANIAAMSTRSRVAELTRMMTTMTTQPAPKAPVTPAKTVSRAPAPPPPVEPSSTKTLPRYSDELSDEEFTAQFNESMAKRSGMRR